MKMCELDGRREWAKRLAAAGLFLVSLSAGAVEPAARVTVSVDPSQTVGPIKPMHAVNNGPSVKKPGGSQKRGNFDEYKALRIPFARTHDSVNCVSGGAHACDISAVFPNFGADENDPKNYDFVFTDHYLDNIRRAGTEVFFRLGQTIEQGPKKYGVMPPKDNAKWARICEHVIRHYNEGWAWGVDRTPGTVNIAWSNQFNIVHWEIWNEPDLDDSGATVPENPRCWGGTETNFFAFFEVAAKYLKGRFPSLKIGGPAICGREDWGERFLAYCEEHEVPLDFFSWHEYNRDPVMIAEKATRIRTVMDRHGYGRARSILNEWNYIRGWRDDFVYSLRVESGDLNLKGAAFAAATMAACQSRPVDMLMYYDARTTTVMNGMFDRVTFWPLKAYYPFYAWSKLAACGTQVVCTVSSVVPDDPNAAPQDPRFVRAPNDGVSAVAAKAKDGSGVVLAVRYSDDDNVCETAEVTFRVAGADLSRARCYLTDLARTFTEVPLEIRADGTATVRLQPLSFAVLEYVNGR